MDLNQFRGINTGKMERLPAASTYVTETDVDWSLKHFFILLALGVLTSVLASYLISLFNALPTFGSLVAATLGLCAVLVVAVFQSLLLKSFQLFLWVTLAEVLGLFAFFFGLLSPWLVFGGIAFVAYMISGFLRGRLDLTDHLTVHFGRFSRIIMTSAIGGLAIFFAFFYVGLYRQHGLSFEAFRFTTSASTPILERFVPTYDPQSDTNVFFEEFTRAQLASNPQFVLLLKSDQDQVVAQTGFQLRNQVVQATTVVSHPGEPFERYLYRVASHYLEMLSAQGLGIIPVFFMILIIYSVIRSVMFFVKWPVIFVSYLVYRVLLSTRLVYITTEPRSKEIIMVK